jgi:tetratricopeptide (TPR) repeat protein
MNIRIGSAFAALLCAASPAFAAPVDYTHVGDWAVCNGSENPDQRINACKSILSGGGLSAQDNAQALNGLALAYDSKGDRDDALGAYAKSLEFDPKAWFTLLNRANIYMAQKKYDLAMADCNAAIAIKPDAWQAYITRGNVYGEQKRPDLKMADYTQAIALDQGVVPYRARARAYIESRDYDRAADDLTASLKSEPENIETLFLRADVYKKLKKPDLADADYHTILNATKFRTGMSFARANAEAGLGDTQAAIADFTAAIAENPKSPASHQRRGKIYEDAGKYDLAFQDFDAAWRLKPDDVGAAHGRGDTLLHQRKYAEAAEAYTQAIQIAPNDAYAYVNRGNAYLGLHDTGKAMMDYDKAVALEPDEASLYDARAELYYTLHDLDRALADEDRSIALAPDYEHAWNGACWWRATANRELQKALDQCNQAVKLDPTGAESLDSLGFVQYRLGHMAEAMASYNAALAADPKIASSLYMRGIIKRGMGDASGDADIAQALALDPKISGTYAGYGVQPIKS